MTRVEIERRAKALPTEDQVDLAYALLENASPALTPEQEREADRRVAAYRRNPGLLVADDEARQIEDPRAPMRLLYTPEALDERGEAFRWYERRL